jgi:DNA-binding winged helix-turn-helix (wHTH) protein/tetratricopeptide (TPR) repeat protein
MLWRDDQPVVLRPKNFAALCYLVERHGQLVTKDELLDNVWQQRCVDESVLKVCINELRQALADDARTPLFIATIARRGYRFIASVTEITPTTEKEDITFEAYGRDQPPGRAAHWINRELAQAQLLTNWQYALKGSRQIAFLTGEAGIGKTTLIDMFLAEISDCAPSILHMRCIEHFGQGEALLPLIEAIERRCHGAEGIKLIELLRRHAPVWLAQLPSVLQPGEREALQGAILGASRERMVREGCELLETLSKNLPLVVVLEDLHWSDYATLDLLSLLARRSEPARLLVLASYRPSDASLEAHPVRRVHRELQLRGVSTEIAVNPFSLVEVDRFLARRFPGTEVSQLASQTLCARTGGHPLFVANLVEYLVSQHRWLPVSQQLAADEALPDTIRRVIERELERLSLEEQRILDIASTIGVQFSTIAVAVAANMEIMAVDRHCDALSKRGCVLVTAGMEKCSHGGIVGCYAFRHALYIEVIYSRLTTIETIRLHLRIGEALETLHGEKALTYAAELALHFEKGWNWIRAVQYLVQAADNASQRFANYEAHGYLLRALGLVEHLPAEQEMETRIALLKQSATIRRSMGDMPGAYADLNSMLDTARISGNQRSEVLALIQLSDILVWLDRRKCLEVAEEAVMRSKNLADPVLQSVASGIWGGLHLLFGQWQQDFANACHEAMAFARSTANSPILHTRLTQHANVELAASNYRTAWVTAEEAIELSRTLGDGYMFMVDHYFGGLALLHLGEWGKLRRLSEQSMRAFESNNASEPFRLHHQIIMGWLHAEACDFAGAKAYCEQAYADSLAAHTTFTSIHCLAILGKALLGLGDHKGAVKCFEAFFQTEKDESLPVNWNYFYPACHGIAEAWLALGEFEKACYFAQRLRDISIDAPERTYLSLSYRLFAEIAIKENCLDEANLQITEALNIVENAEAPLAAWRVYASAEKLYGLCSNADKVNEYQCRRQKVINQLMESLQDSDPLRENLWNSQKLTPVTF